MLKNNLVSLQYVWEIFWTTCNTQGYWPIVWTHMVLSEDMSITVMVKNINMTIYISFLFIEIDIWFNIYVSTHTQKTPYMYRNHHTDMRPHTRIVIIFRHCTSIVKDWDTYRYVLCDNTSLCIVFVKPICIKSVRAHLFLNKNHIHMVTLQ